MNFANQAFNGFVVHRNYEDNTTYVDVQKVKFKYLGEFGTVALQWSRDLGGSYWKLDRNVKVEQAILPYKDSNDDQLPF